MFEPKVYCTIYHSLVLTVMDSSGINKLYFMLYNSYRRSNFNTLGFHETELGIGSFFLPPILDIDGLHHSCQQENKINTPGTRVGQDYRN